VSLLSTRPDAAKVDIPRTPPTISVVEVPTPVTGTHVADLVEKKELDGLHSSIMETKQPRRRSSVGEGLNR